MKKVLVALVLASVVTACKNSSESSTAGDTTITYDTNPAPEDTTQVGTDSASSKTTITTTTDTINK